MWHDWIVFFFFFCDTTQNMSVVNWSGSSAVVHVQGKWLCLLPERMKNEDVFIFFPHYFNYIFLQSVPKSSSAISNFFKSQIHVMTFETLSRNLKCIKCFDPSCLKIELFLEMCVHWTVCFELKRPQRKLFELLTKK